jgi:hypothetical protein
VEPGNHLGIYWKANKATVVCLAPPGRERKLLDCFTVSVEGQQQQSQQALADHIVQTCRQRKVKFMEAAVALDCAGFMQHSVHSEFSDPKRIAATIRFDTEEALATDISDMAVAFRITSSGQDGSNLDVFTAQRAILSDIILSLQSHGIDPVAVDPDICCLARYLGEYAKPPELPEQSTLHAMLSDSQGYLVVVPGSQQASVLRTFLIGPAQERTALLARETLVTAALVETNHPVRHLSVFDEAGDLSAQALGERTGFAVSTFDLAGLAGVKPGDMTGRPNAVDLALACGAALAPAQKTDSVNLRNDHMPYLGKKRRFQNAVRFLSISVTILLLAVGVYFHSQLIRVNKQREGLRDKLEDDYLQVMPGKPKLPPTMKEAVGDLSKLLRRLRAEKGTGGETDQDSVYAKLTSVLQGLNGCARDTNLNITSVTITAKIVIVGDTSSRQNTQNAVKAIGEIMKKSGIIVGPGGVHTEGDRDAFTITAERAKPTKGA